MGKDDKPDPNEKVEMTRAELEALLERKDRDAKMDPAEKRLREISREEGKTGALEALHEFFSDLDEGPDGGDNDGGGASLGDALRELVGLKKK